MNSQRRAALASPSRQSGAESNAAPHERLAHQTLTSLDETKASVSLEQRGGRELRQTWHVCPSRFVRRLYLRIQRRLERVLNHARTPVYVEEHGEPGPMGAAAASSGAAPRARARGWARTARCHDQDVSMSFIRLPPQAGHARAHVLCPRATHLARLIFPSRCHMAPTRAGRDESLRNGRGCHARSMPAPYFAIHPAPSEVVAEPMPRSMRP